MALASAWPLTPCSCPGGCQVEHAGRCGRPIARLVAGNGVTVHCYVCATGRQPEPRLRDLLDHPTPAMAGLTAQERRSTGRTERPRERVLFVMDG